MDVEILYREHGKVLFGYLVAQTGDYASAQDLFQDTFLRLQRYGASYSGAGSAKNYLFATARNIFRDWLKRRKTENPDMLEAVSVNGDPKVTAERESLRESVATCVHSLPREQREVLVLREYEDLRVRQIAEHLSIPEGTVKTRLRRGLQTLKSRLHSAGILERL